MHETHIKYIIDKMLYVRDQEQIYNILVQPFLLLGWEQVGDFCKTRYNYQGYGYAELEIYIEIEQKKIKRVRYLVRFFSRQKNHLISESIFTTASDAIACVREISDAIVELEEPSVSKIFSTEFSEDWISNSMPKLQSLNHEHTER